MVLSGSNDQGFTMRPDHNSWSHKHLISSFLATLQLLQTAPSLFLSRWLCLLLGFYVPSLLAFPMSHVQVGNIKHGLQPV